MCTPPLKQFMRIAKYSSSFLLFLILCLVPVENQTALAPANELPSYMVSSTTDDSQETIVRSRTSTTSTEKRIRFLLLGTDERADEASRSDTIILATYFPNEGKMNLLSIPRDTKVWIPGENKLDKINAAHAYGGMEQIKETVEVWSGLDIAHVAKVNFNGFQTLIDGVGGVTVSPERAFEYGGDSFELGDQHIDGEQALNYVRFRKDQDGDFGRIKRQQEVIENTLSSILTDFRIASLPSYLTFYKEHVQTDMSFFDLSSLAKTAYSNGLSIEGQTLPTHSAKINGIWFEETYAQDVSASLLWLENNEKEPEIRMVSRKTGAEVSEFVEKKLGYLQ